MSESQERYPVGPRGAQGVQGERGRGGLSQLQGRAVVVLFLLGALFGAGNLLWTAHQVNVGNHKWCAAMTLLTSKPVPRPADPAANPSREQGWQFYETFVVLRHKLGCG